MMKRTPYIHPKLRNTKIAVGQQTLHLDGEGYVCLEEGDDLYSGTVARLEKRFRKDGALAGEFDADQKQRRLTALKAQARAIEGQAKALFEKHNRILGQIEELEAEVEKESSGQEEAQKESSEQEAGDVQPEAPWSLEQMRADIEAHGFSNDKGRGRAHARQFGVTARSGPELLEEWEKFLAA